jgi:hypothetical protein
MNDSGDTHTMTIKKLLAYGVWAVCLVITTADARAAVTSFQDRDLWNAAVGGLGGSLGPTTSLDFTGSVPDDGSTFLFDPVTLNGFEIERANDAHAWLTGPDYPTVIPDLYDWGSGASLTFNNIGAPLTIRFASPVLAFGFDFGIFNVFPGGASYGGLVNLQLPDGTIAVGSAEKTKALTFLGVVSTTPFDYVTLSGAPVVVTDNLTRVAAASNEVPEPAGLSMVGMLLLCGSVVVRRRLRTR